MNLSKTLPLIITLGSCILLIFVLHALVDIFLHHTFTIDELRIGILVFLLSLSLFLLYTLILGFLKMKRVKISSTLLFLILFSSFVFFTFYSNEWRGESIQYNLSLSDYHDSYYELRQKMVSEQLASRDIHDPKVLKVMSEIPRHEFIPEKMRFQAYEDHPVPIGYGQTISQPYIVALMTQSLDLRGDEKVLEIGTGSGYQAAVLSRIVKEVYTIEIIPELAERANRTLHTLNYSNVHVKIGDGYYGWKEKAPFDAIIITAACDHVPPPLLKQLKKGGRLILPLGDVRTYQTLTLIEKKSEEKFLTTYITNVRFVPLTGGH